MNTSARLAQSVEHQTFRTDSTQTSEGQGFESLVGRNIFSFLPYFFLPALFFIAQFFIASYYILTIKSKPFVFTQLRPTPNAEKDLSG